MLYPIALTKNTIGKGADFASTINTGATLIN